MTISMSKIKNNTTVNLVRNSLGYSIFIKLKSTEEVASLLKRLL